MKPALLWMVFAILFVGCGKGDPKIVPVTGTVTRGGVAVPNVIVNFVPEGGHPSQGKADGQGHFTLNYDRTTKGAVIGKNKVYVEFPPSSPVEEGKALAKRSLSKEQREILNKYGDPKAPAIEINIEKKNQQVEVKLD